MSTLGTGKGEFKLDDSNKFVGSLFSVEDIYNILEIDLVSIDDFRNSLQSLGILKKEGNVDENDLYKNYKTLKDLYSTIKLLNTVSLDECILKQIFKRALPNAVITQQVGFKDKNTNRQKSVDFKIEYKGEIKFVEFEGPSHYYSRYESSLKNPLDRKRQIEDVFGYECVLWPFWIQRCDCNAKALFDETISGLGALWSTNILFNSFIIPSPGQVIIEETKRFHAEREKGIGYFYGGNTENRQMPEHPIVNKILKGKKQIDEIIPSDIVNEKEYWLPEKLWHLLR